MVAPPGAGKSFIMLRLAEIEAKLGGNTLLLAHRNMLIDQLSRDFRKDGQDFTCLATEYSYQPGKPVTIASLPLLYERCIKREKIPLPTPTLVLVDEAHLQNGSRFRAAVLGMVNGNIVTPGFLPRGADIVGFTATPTMERQGVYSELLELATYKQLRAENMHQVLRVFSPDEIDTSGLTKNTNGDFSSKKLEKRAMVIYGSAIEEYNKLNPERLPALLYGPSVECSRWFCQQFNSAGIKTAHIDGEKIMLPHGSNGFEMLRNDGELRNEILERHREGDIKIISNRFVLREAIDMPWVYHGIFATVFGGMSGYLQSVGRLQRFWPEYDYKILQCHGGSYWRHGSPNMDRAWELGDTNMKLAERRAEACRRNEQPEGIRCPECGCWRKKSTNECPNCNYRHLASVRVVRQLSGKLKRMTGRVFTRTSETDQVTKLWKRYIFSSGQKGRTVRACVKLFSDRARLLNLKVDWTKLPYGVPDPDSKDWGRKVSKVYPFTDPQRRKAWRAKERGRKIKLED